MSSDATSQLEMMQKLSPFMHAEIQKKVRKCMQLLMIIHSPSDQKQQKQQNKYTENRNRNNSKSNIHVETAN